jgi:hypothetical protein
MSGRSVIVLVLFAASHVFAQVASESETECKFLDGKSIKVNSSNQVGPSARLTIDERLVTMKGIGVPAGDYTVSPARDSGNKWSLTMRKAADNRALPAVPLSAHVPTSPILDTTISFKREGASCFMKWAVKEANVLLSLEFTERNIDTPLLP